MKYWVYINDKVDGPYDEASLVTLSGFTPDTLICSEEVASQGGQEWVKASSVFEFDEVPAEETPAPKPVQAAPANDAANTQVLLDRINALFTEVSLLQTKMSSMQTDLDQALEQNKQLAQQIAVSSNQATQLDIPVPEEEPPAINTITLTRSDMKEEPQPETTYPEQETPKEEELIIRSALDSMYGGKTVEQHAQETQEKEKDNDFHDLVTGETSADLAREEEEEEIRDIETQLNFTPIAEEEPAVEKAVITTPSLLDAQKDELINELTASPKEDVLDQIIAEHQQEETNNQATTSDGVIVGATLTASGLAAAALVAGTSASGKDSQEPAFTLATDKNDPTHVEEVLPADQLPEDVLPPAIEEKKEEAEEDKEEQKPQETASQLPIMDTPQEMEEQPAQEEPLPQTAELPVTDMPQELPQPVSQEVAPQAAELPVTDIPQELPQPQEQETQSQSALPSLEEQEQPAVSQAEPEILPDPIEKTIEELIPAKEKTPEPAEEQTDEQEILSQTDLEAALDKDLSQESAPVDVKPMVEQALEQPQVVPQEPVDKQPQAGITQKDLEDAFGKDGLEADLAAAEPAEPAPEQPQDDSQETDGEQPQAGITQKDLEDAFGEDVLQTPPPADPDAAAKAALGVSMLVEGGDDAPSNNPNELTEIELKEGSTYLISDFVPPAQVEESGEAEKDANEKPPHETIFQDMLAASLKKQSTQPLSTDGLPDDLSATQINLENTIQAKRGASLDIKTVPMVPDPSKTGRLDVNELSDVNAQHGMKNASSNKWAKRIVFGLIAILVLIIAYVVLAFLHVLPSSINLLAGKSQTAVAADNQQTQDLLDQEQAPAQPATPSLSEQAQEKVKNFPLPNGYTLKGFIESKYPTISADLITWETTEAVEPDNYSVTVKVPPENPQNFKTVYRFNYNMQSGMLDPTVSDAKNLLDQAYGINVAQSAAVEAVSKPAPASKQRRTGTRRTTSRKR